MITLQKIYLEYHTLAANIARGIIKLETKIYKSKANINIYKYILDALPRFAVTQCGCMDEEYQCSRKLRFQHYYL